MIKGAIFDMDGTLFDTERLYARSWVLTAEQFGLKPHSDFPYAIAGTSGAKEREIVRQYYPSVDAEMFIDACIIHMNRMLEKELPEKPGMREILSFFKDHAVKMAVASSSRREGIVENLERAGIYGLFDAIVSGEEVENGKPAPDIFLLAAGRLGLEPGECYVFEDSINGVRAGIAAGCETVMIPDLVPPAEDLQRGCRGIYSSLWEARREIAGLFSVRDLE